MTRRRKNEWQGIIDRIASIITIASPFPAFCRPGGAFYLVSSRGLDREETSDA